MTGFSLLPTTVIIDPFAFCILCWYIVVFPWMEGTRKKSPILVAILLLAVIGGILAYMTSRGKTVTPLQEEGMRIIFSTPIPTETPTPQASPSATPKLTPTSRPRPTVAPTKPATTTPAAVSPTPSPTPKATVSPSPNP